MNMDNEQIKHAASSIIAMRNKHAPEIDRICASSKYALRVEIDKTKALLDDANLLKESWGL
jgi:hypothetical protein